MGKRAGVMQSVVFVVVGSTGEYADAHEWLVAAYLDEKAAARHAEGARLRALELHAWHCGTCDTGWIYHRKGCGEDRPSSEWDPSISIDYTGTSYSVVPVDMWE